MSQLLLSVSLWSDGVLGPRGFSENTRGQSLVRSVLLGVILCSLNAVRAQAGEFELTLRAGAVPRQHSVVSLDCPPSIWAPELSKGERRIPIQIGLDGRLHFLVEALEAGESTKLRLRNRPSGTAQAEGVAVVRDGDAIRFDLSEQPLIQYQAAPSALPREAIDPVYRRGGYLHPVWSPSGLIVTDDYPSNHLHHHGIWNAWTKTRFEGRAPNFWEMGQKKGTVEFVAVDHYWSGAVFGGVRSRHRYVDLTVSESVVVLRETWELKVYAIRESARPYRLFDLRMIQECATEKPLKLPQYRYGGLGFRGHHEWDGAENAHFLTAQGETDRIKGHATRARWCHIGGSIGTGWSGVAILCHPSNFRAPQPMRIHPSEPFFCYASVQLGDWEIRPGVPHESRYRFVVFDGPPDKDVIDRHWNDYADPIRVSVVEVE